MKQFLRSHFNIEGGQAMCGCVATVMVQLCKYHIHMYTDKYCLYNTNPQTHTNKCTHAPHTQTHTHLTYAMVHAYVQFQELGNFIKINSIHRPNTKQKFIYNGAVISLMHIIE